jgi:L-lactate dehydrogenase complex protein LldG
MMTVRGAKMMTPRHEVMLGVYRGLRVWCADEHRGVFGRNADDMAPFAVMAIRHAADGQVVALGRSAGEDDFLGPGADCGGDALARRQFALQAEAAEVFQGAVAEVLKNRQPLLPAKPSSAGFAPTPAAMAQRFAEELKEVHGETIRCGSMDEARRHLLVLMDEAKWPLIGAVDGRITRELTSSLPPDRVAWVSGDWPPTKIAELPAGVIPAEALLADTGSCVIACPTAHERLMCYLPSASVVIARTEQLAEHLPAAWEAMARQCGDPQARGELLIVTGPSRTADIEKILILGVHGPQRLVVLLVD